MLIFNTIFITTTYKGGLGCLDLDSRLQISIESKFFYNNLDLLLKQNLFCNKKAKFRQITMFSDFAHT